MPQLVKLVNNGLVLFRECAQTRSGSVSASNCQMLRAPEKYRDRVRVLRAFNHKIPQKIEVRFQKCRLCFWN